MSGEFLDLTVGRDDQDLLQATVEKLERQIVNTTVGRVIFNNSLPDEIPFINGLLKKQGLQQLVQYSYLRNGLAPTVSMLDGLKDLGFFIRDQVRALDRDRRPRHPEGETLTCQAGQH